MIRFSGLQADSLSFISFGFGNVLQAGRGNWTWKQDQGVWLDGVAEGGEVGDEVAEEYIVEIVQLGSVMIV